MADWSLPSITSDYITGVLPNLNSKDVDAATMVKTATNMPTNFKAWDSGNSKFQNWNGASWDDLVLSVAGGGTGAATAASARTNLGLGTMSTQNSNAVSITGGAISGVTMDASVLTSGTVALNRGGTGQSLSLGALGTVLLSNGSAVVFSSGANIANLNASNLSSGTVPDARFPATLPALSGVNLTALNASNLGSGTVPDARFPATLPALDGHLLTGVVVPLPVLNDDTDVALDGTVYNAGSYGGIVMVSAEPVVDPAGIKIFADNFNPPTTLRIRSYGPLNVPCGATCAIPANWYFKVTKDGLMAGDYGKLVTLHP